jgi:phospholipase A1
MKIVLILIFLASFVYAEKEMKLDNVTDMETKASMEDWLEHNFGLRPYRTNYLLPFCYADKPYATNLPDVDYSNFEVELQISLMLKVGTDLFGLKERYYLSYTQHSFWQLYIDSSPFRETNYNPEAFVIFPVSHKNAYFNLRSVKLAFAHQSNGQPDTSDVVFEENKKLGNLSKSINYLYTTVRLQRQSLLLDLKAWYRIPEDPESDDNPDIMQYLGYTSAKMTYFYGNNMFTALGRLNFSTGRGAFEATYSYPLIHNNFYAKFFTGYTESLIDYDKYITKLSVGFSFSR